MLTYLLKNLPSRGSLQANVDRCFDLSLVSFLWLVVSRAQLFTRSSPCSNFEVQLIIHSYTILVSFLFSRVITCALSALWTFSKQLVFLWAATTHSEEFRRESLRRHFNDAARASHRHTRCYKSACVPLICISSRSPLMQGLTIRFWYSTDYPRTNWPLLDFDSVARRHSSP